MEAFAFPWFPAPRSSPARGSAVGNETGYEGDGRARGRRPRPCPGSAAGVGGAALGGSGGRGSGEDGAAWLPASVCCAVSLPTLLPHGRHFKVLSAVAAPCGALPSRPARAISFSVAEARSPLREITEAACFSPRPPLFFFKKFL